MSAEHSFSPHLHPIGHFAAITGSLMTSGYSSVPGLSQATLPGMHTGILGAMLVVPGRDPLETGGGYTLAPSPRRPV